MNTKKTILVNTKNKEETRLAILHDKTLSDLRINCASKQSYKNNIYVAVVTRIENGLEAAFVNYGGNRQGFLSFKELAPQYLADTQPEPQKQNTQPESQELDSNTEFTEDEAQQSDDATEDENASDENIHASTRPNINLKPGDKVVIQVSKEERGTKGAALTTLISIAGRYLVYLPFNHSVSGISRRINNEDRQDIRSILSELKVPEASGVIIRTAGVNQKNEELQADLDRLLEFWNSIQSKAKQFNVPTLLSAEHDIETLIVRDYLSDDVDKVIIDDQEVYNKCYHFVSHLLPNMVDRLSYYESDVPLFSHYDIESQIQIAYQQKVNLPSGGAIVIDATEALISIDVNSGKSIKLNDIEETALNTNLEAAETIARQLRLRDAGGLIVIDFIDMFRTQNQKHVRQILAKALSEDKARIQIGTISKFGLLEMSRQRLGTALQDINTKLCSHCQGTGRIRSAHSVTLTIMHLIQEEIQSIKAKEMIIESGLSVISILSNEKRKMIADLEAKHDVEIKLMVDLELESPHYRIKTSSQDNHVHVLIDTHLSFIDTHTTAKKQERKNNTKAALYSKEILSKKKEKGLIARFFGALISLFKKSKPKNNRRKNWHRGGDHKKRVGGENNSRSRNNQNRRRRNNSSRSGNYNPEHKQNNNSNPNARQKT